MIYAMSDLHGCYDKYIKMLEKIGFNENDSLYVLGDIVDRGDGGIKILQNMMTRRNVFVIRGNHDYLSYRLLKLLSQPSDMFDSENVSELYQSWLFDGGVPTYEAFMELSTDEQRKILSYMNSFFIYDEISVNEKSFFMAHTVPSKERMQDFNKLLWQEFIIGEPEYEKEYFPDKIIITGHTPTGFIDPKHKGKIWHGNNHIAVDCGAVFGNPLGCICLDTLEEFYV